MKRHITTSLKSVLTKLNSTRKGTFMTVMQIGLIASLPLAFMMGNVYWWLAAIGMYILYAGIGTVVTMHRLLSHRVFKAPKWLYYGGTFFATVGSLLTPLEWVHQHVDHHRFADQPEDPHSPVQLGWKAAFFTYHGQGTGTRAAGRLSRDPYMRVLHKYFYPILALYVTALLLVSVKAFIFLWAVPCLMALWGQILIVFAHDENGATNSGFVLRMITFGENRHVRHHEDPRDISQDGPALWFINLVRTDK